MRGHSHCRSLALLSCNDLTCSYHTPPSLMMTPPLMMLFFSFFLSFHSSRSPYLRVVPATRPMLNALAPAAGVYAAMMPMHGWVLVVVLLLSLAYLYKQHPAFFDVVYDEWNETDMKRLKYVSSTLDKYSQVVAGSACVAPGRATFSECFEIGVAASQPPTPLLQPLHLICVCVFRCSRVSAFACLSPSVACALVGVPLLLARFCCASFAFSPVHPSVRPSCGLAARRFVAFWRSRCRARCFNATTWATFSATPRPASSGSFNLVGFMHVNA